MSRDIPDVATAKRCVEVCAKYLAERDDSPKAAADLQESVRVISATASDPLRAALTELQNITRWFTKDKVEIPLGEWRELMTQVEQALADAQEP